MTNINRVLVTNALSEKSLLLINRLSSEKKCQIRCFVSEEGKHDISKLQNLANVEVLRGSMQNKESLKKALDGIDGVFLNIDFTNIPETEENALKQGELFLDTCRELGTIKHIIFCSVEHAELIPQETAKYFIPEFVGAYKLSGRLKESGISFTELKIGLLMNKIPPLVTYRAEDQVYEFNIPMADKPLDLLMPEDLGYAAAKIFGNPDNYKNMSLPLAGDSLPVELMVAKFNKLTHKKARYPEISVKHFKEMKLVPDADILGNIFHFFQDTAERGRLDLKTSRQCFEELHTWEDWINSGSWELPEERR